MFVCVCVCVCVCVPPFLVGVVLDRFLGLPFPACAFHVTPGRAFGPVLVFVGRFWFLCVAAPSRPVTPFLAGALASLGFCRLHFVALPPFLTFASRPCQGEFECESGGGGTKWGSFGMKRGW